MTGGKMKKCIRIKAVFLLLLILVCSVLILKGVGKNGGQETSSAEEENVRTEELAGYLTVIPLTPDETRKLILPELNEVMTGEDVKKVFQKLNLESCLIEMTEGLDLAEDKPVSRVQWSKLYDRLLEKLGVSKNVTEVQIQYLGDVSEEDRIIADNGNYDCDKGSCQFQYGKTYTVYVKDNFILGRKDAEQTEESKKKEAQEEKNTTETSLKIPETVKVLLTQDNGEKAYRTNVWVKCEDGVEVTSGKKKETIGKSKTVNCKSWMKKWNTETLTIKPSGESRLYLTDKNGKTCSYGYRGTFLVKKNESGYWVVNQLPLEQYLYGVVPGEMPSEFEMEALKVQAICARTYTCRQIAGGRYEKFGADVDDTTDCQVYQTLGETKRTNQAVNLTKGQVLVKDGTYAQIYYFSSSCGYTSGMEVWGEKAVSHLKTVSLVTSKEKFKNFDAFIKNKNVEAYDSDSIYFRWTAKLNLKDASKEMRTCLQQYQENGDSNVVVTDTAEKKRKQASGLGTCKKITVEKRAQSGVVTDLKCSFSKGTVHIYDENIIRTVLKKAQVTLKDKNGKEQSSLSILPSAAFSAEDQGKGVCVLYGGGLGHSVGMSQHGANGMAEAGMNCREILETFFAGTQIVKG